MFGFRKVMQHSLAPVAFAMVSLAASGALALDPAKGAVILTVTGAISQTNAGDAAEFDIAMLEEIGTVTIRTSTIWTKGEQVFTGVELSDLLEAVGADGATLRATAINDYAVDIPASDALTGGPVIAFQRNGEEMSIRDKGPLWIVYPYDSSEDYQTELVYSRSIWQLDRIEVQP